MTNETKKTKPSHNIFVKTFKNGESQLGSKIGIGFSHKDGQGLNIILDAAPLPTPNGQIELVAFSTKPNT